MDVQKHAKIARASNLKIAKKRKKCIKTARANN